MALKFYDIVRKSCYFLVLKNRTTSEESRALSLAHIHNSSESEQPNFVPYNNTILELNSTYEGNSTEDGFHHYHLDFETFTSFLTKSKYIVDDDHEYFWRKHIYMMFYIGLAVIVLVVDVVRTIYMFYYTMRISRNLHRKMFACVVQAPIKFFDDNPSGMLPFFIIIIVCHLHALQGWGNVIQRKFLACKIKYASMCLVVHFFSGIIMCRLRIF